MRDLLDRAKQYLTNNINLTIILKIAQIGALIWIGSGLNNIETAIYQIDAQQDFSEIESKLEGISDRLIYLAH